jgi:xylose dehydrogenase (NAD/NADP)
MGTKKLRWGILGAATIAEGAVIPAIQQSELGELTAIASRNIEKSKRLADKFQISKYFDNYDDLLADESIDAVYIPLPNHLHHEWTIKAAKAGKHVLVEKPASLNASLTAEMVNACNAAGVNFTEAFMYRYHLRYAMIKQIVDSGEIGELQGIQGSFTFFYDGDPQNYRLDPSMGGGSLYDIGVYPVSAARLFFGTEPEAATVHALFKEEFGGVDMMASGVLEFPGGKALTFECGMLANFRNSLHLTGTKGHIEVPYAYLSTNRNENFFLTKDDVTREIEVPSANSYVCQVDDFARSVLNNEPNKFKAEDAVLNMKVIDACLTSARERKRIIIEG